MRFRSALLLGFSMSGAVLACGGLNGDSELRPSLLTPTIRQAGMPPEGAATPSGPPPTPVGTPDEDGYISGPLQECAGTPAPTTGVMLDFTKYALPNGSWGVAADGDLTGGTSLYSLAPADTIQRSLVGDQLHMESAIGSGAYAGIVFWFQPCVNASAFSGLEFAASGDLGGSTLIVKPQTSVDYPIDPMNAKGKCRFMANTSKYTECQQPTVQFTTLPAAPIRQTWMSFMDGVPLPMDPAQMLGFELQFSCPPTGSGCALKFDLGTVTFLP
jgi:hypothetical protein